MGKRDRQSKAMKLCALWGSEFLHMRSVSLSFPPSVKLFKSPKKKPIRRMLFLWLHRLF